jgi:creatinine amidohydrolase/Fe(II)-dependent formamide hydrolase-like protein
MAYVPEAMQMAYPGTLSLSDATFQAVLEDTAISLKTHGFRQIYLLGDSFGNQEPQEEAVEELAEDFAEEGIRLASLDEYYAANGQMEWLKEQGFSEEEIGGHAGIRDTSEIMALYPQGIRPDKLADRYGANESGANGKSTAASATIGQKMLELKIEAALRQIRSLEAEALDK